jgi:hypothetical protein
VTSEERFARVRASLEKKEAAVVADRNRRRLIMHARSQARWKERARVIDIIESVPVKSRTMRAVLEAIVAQVRSER